MFKLPQSIIIAFIAFNFSAFAAVQLMGIVTFKSPWVLIVTLVLTIGLWGLAYSRRKKYFILF